VSLPRLALVVAGLVFLGLGTFLFFAPDTIGRLTGATRLQPMLVTELRATYGGLQIGLGLYFFVAASRGRWVRSALAAQVAVFGGLAGGRVAAMVLAREYSGLFLAIAAAELLGALLGGAGLRKARALMELNYSRRL